MCDQPGHLLLKSLAEPAIEPGPRNIGNNYSVLFAADTRGRRFNKGLAAADIQSAPATCSTSSVVVFCLAMAPAAPALLRFCGPCRNNKRIGFGFKEKVLHDHTTQYFFITIVHGYEAEDLVEDNISIASDVDSQCHFAKKTHNL